MKLPVANVQGHMSFKLSFETIVLTCSCVQYMKSSNSYRYLDI